MKEEKMIKNLTKYSTSTALAFMLLACGGGGGGTSPATTTTQSGTNTPNTQTPTTGNLPAPSTNTALCQGTQTAFALGKEVNGDLNIEKDNTEDCYKISLSSNNASETYTFFMNMLPGTEGFTRSEITLIDMNNQETPLNDKNKLYDADKHLRNTFTVIKDGTYYIKIKRGTSKTKYAFSLHPSVENGLVQGKDKEINDTPSMAAPITPTEAMNDINGSLHVTRDAYNSLRGSDDTDYYSIDITKAGKYTFFMNKLPGSSTYVRTDVRFIDENEAETPMTSGDLTFYGTYAYNLRKEITLAKGKHKIRIYSGNDKMKYAFSLYPSIINGLKQNSDKEPNDTPSMAAPLTMAEVTTGITGSLNFTRDDLNSLRGTDNIDRYRITISEAGEYTVDMSLLAGTEEYYNDLDARFISDDGAEIPITSLSNRLYTIDAITQDVTLEAGSYNLQIYRKTKIAKYSFKMTKKN